MPYGVRDNLELSETLQEEVQSLLASRQVLKVVRLLFENGYNYFEWRQIISQEIDRFTARRNGKSIYIIFTEWRHEKSDDEQRIIEERFWRYIDDPYLIELYNRDSDDRFQR
jgi:hypothetical protein